MNRTYSAKPTDIVRDWIVLDATGVPVGRLAVEAAKLLRGKHKPTFTPHMDTGRSRHYHQRRPGRVHGQQQAR
jgi:large subunit ribosomal protein L13